jgi:hypothetical protein
MLFDANPFDFDTEGRIPVTKRFRKCLPVFVLAVSGIGASSCKPQSDSERRVFDSKNVIVGELIGQGVVISQVEGTPVTISVSPNGLLVNVGPHLLYTSQDCTGTAYISAGIPTPGFILDATIERLATSGQSVAGGLVVYANPSTIQEIKIGSYRSFVDSVSPVRGGSCFPPQSPRLFATVGIPVSATLNFTPPFNLGAANK